MRALLSRSTSTLSTRWQHLLTSALDKKLPGLHPYTAEASAKLTAHHLQSIISNTNCTKFRIQSGCFAYDVNTLSLEQCNLKTGALRQIRQSSLSHGNPSPKRQKLMPCFASLFGGAHEHTWERLLTSLLQSQQSVETFLGTGRHSEIVPVRELTFQALKPQPPAG